MHELCIDSQKVKGRFRTSSHYSFKKKKRIDTRNTTAANKEYPALSKDATLWHKTNAKHWTSKCCPEQKVSLPLQQMAWKRSSTNQQHNNKRYVCQKILNDKRPSQIYKEDAAFYCVTWITKRVTGALSGFLYPRCSNVPLYIYI